MNSTTTTTSQTPPQTPLQSPREILSPPLAPVRERMVARPVNPGFTVYEFLQNPTHPPTNGPADV
jgi:hypothetical protein